jgi:hypothetical protein
MLLFGPRKCPKCGLPVSKEAMVCYYCHVTVPRSKIWDCGSWLIGAALVFLLVSAFGPDNLLGSRVTQTLQGFRGFIPGAGN